MEIESNDVQTLRRLARDLVTVSAVAEIWAGKSCFSITDSVANLLWRVLDLDLVYVRAPPDAKGRVREVAYTELDTTMGKSAQALGEWLRPWVERAGMGTVTDIPSLQQIGTLRLFALPVGHNGTCGLVAVASRKPDFPSQWQKGLLTVCINQAAIGLENARSYQYARIELGQRMRAEAELRKLNQTLDQRVADRTAVLRRVNVELQKRNREVQDFVFIASHDLREPLRKITTFADMLRSSCQDQIREEGLEYLGRIENSTVRMVALLDDLRTYSRIQTQGEPFRPVDLNHVFQTLLCDLDLDIREASATINLSELPTIDADPFQLKQLLKQLVENALRYRRENVTPVIYVKAEPACVALDGGPELRDACIVTVEDEGIGFDEKYRERIFGPFQRLHGRDRYPGTGMGLAICRRIAERHGGTLTAQSQPGYGSTFTLTLPIRQDAPCSDLPLS